MLAISTSKWDCGCTWHRCWPLNKSRNCVVSLFAFPSVANTQARWPKNRRTLIYSGCLSLKREISGCLFGSDGSFPWYYLVVFSFLFFKVTELIRSRKVSSFWLGLLESGSIRVCRGKKTNLKQFKFKPCGTFKCLT